MERKVIYLNQLLVECESDLGQIFYYRKSNKSCPEKFIYLTIDTAALNKIWLLVKMALSPARFAFLIVESALTPKNIWAV